MKIYRSMKGSSRPLRLFVGGVHGKECRTTKLILERFIRTRRLEKGSAVVVPCLYMGRYVSTLNSTYLKLKAGKRLMRLVEKLRPDIYVELHCYRLSSYGSLTNPNRLSLKGVPPLIELEKGVLMGSISPLLQARFNLEMPILIEIPCGETKCFNVVLNILTAFLDACSTQNALKKLSSKYRMQILQILTLVEKQWSGGRIA